MARYDVVRNKGGRGLTDTPYLLDVQADILGQLHTRMVVPLRRSEGIRHPIRRLQPTFRVEGVQVMMDTPALVGAPIADLGESVGSLAADSPAVLAALDFLFKGI